jgi:hypothetical protein
MFRKFIQIIFNNYIHSGYSISLFAYQPKNDFLAQKRKVLNIMLIVHKLTIFNLAHVHIYIF